MGCYQYIYLLKNKKDGKYLNELRFSWNSEKENNKRKPKEGRNL